MWKQINITMITRIGLLLKSLFLVSVLFGLLLLKQIFNKRELQRLGYGYNKFKLSGDRIQTTVKRRCFIQERDFTNLISTTGSNGDAFISTEKEVAYFDPKIIIYNRVQKCGSRTILQAVRPILEFNNVAFEAKELKFYLTNEEQTKFRNDLGTVMT